jgi:hypothetical protein
VDGGKMRWEINYLLAIICSGGIGFQIAILAFFPETDITIAIIAILVSVIGIIAGYGAIRTRIK